MKWIRDNCRTCIFAMTAMIFITSDYALGQDGVNNLKPETALDEVFIFRSVLTGLLAILIWVAKGADKRLKDLEEFSKEAKEKRIEGFTRLQDLEDKWKLIIHEQKELVNLIGIQRELMLTQYMDKNSIEKHWSLVEGTLKEHSQFLRTISIQLEAAQQRKAGEERRRT